MGEPVFETRAELEAWERSEEGFALAHFIAGNRTLEQSQERFREIRRVVANHGHLEDTTP